MRRRSDVILKVSILAGAALMLAPLFVFGQEKAPAKPESQQEGDAIFSAESRLVPLNVTVTDKNGHLVVDLPRSAFTVFENNVAL